MFQYLIDKAQQLGTKVVNKLSRWRDRTIRSMYDSLYIVVDRTIAYLHSTKQSMIRSYLIWCRKRKTYVPGPRAKLYKSIRSYNLPEKNSKHPNYKQQKDFPPLKRPIVVELYNMFMRRLQRVWAPVYATSGKGYHTFEFYPRIQMADKFGTMRYISTDYIRGDLFRHDDPTLWGYINTT